MLPALPLARLRGAALAAVMLLLGALPATSQAQTDADAKTLAAYRLTESGLGRVEQAARNMAAALEDPAVRAQVEGMEDDDDDDVESPTLAQMAAHFDRMPFARRAIASAGMSTLEFVTFQLSLLQASMAAAVLEMQPSATLPAGTPKENVAFVQAHRARLEKFGEEMRALNKRGGDGADDHDDEPDPAVAQR